MVTGLGILCPFMVWTFGRFWGVPLMKFLPTLHPASLLPNRDPSMWGVVLHDLRRAKRESEFPEIRSPQVEVTIHDYAHSAITLLEGILPSKPVSVDVETWQGKVSCVGLAWGDNEATTVPLINSDGDAAWGGGSEKEISDALFNVLAFADPLIVHNALFDIPLLKELLDMDFSPRCVFDTMLAHHLLYAEHEHTLAFVQSIYSELPYHKHLGDFTKPPDEILLYYCGLDALAAFQCYAPLRQELADTGMLEYFQREVMPLTAVVERMEKRGLLVDEEARAALEEEFSLRLDECAGVLTEVGGEEFNPNSTKQLAEILFDKLGLPSSKRTPTGRRSTDEETLQRLKKRAKDEALEFLEAMGEHREAKKLLSTYVKKAKSGARRASGLRVSEDGRHRVSVLMHGTVSLRFSTSPNIQNIPERIRRMYVPPPGHLLINADYFQIELRVMAYLAGAKNLIGALEEGGDIHRLIASHIYGVDPLDITKDQRFMGKVCVHQMNYGATPHGMSRSLGIKVVEAKRIWEAWFKFVPELAEFHELVEETGKRERKLVNPFGVERKFLGHYNPKDGFNWMGQSTAACVIRRAMLRLPEHLHLLVQVHDSLLFEHPSQTVDEASKLIEEAMVYPVEINGYNVTFPVTIKTGETWEEVS